MNKKEYLKISNNLFYSTNKNRGIEIIVDFAKCNHWHYEAIIRNLTLNSTMFMINGTIDYIFKNKCGKIDNYIYSTKTIEYSIIQNDNDYTYFNETIDSIKYIINDIFINEIMEREENVNN